MMPMLSLPSEAAVGDVVTIACSVTFGGPDFDHLTFTESQFPVVNLTIDHQDVAGVINQSLTVMRVNDNQMIYTVHKVYYTLRLLLPIICHRVDMKIQFCYRFAWILGLFLGRQILDHNFQTFVKWFARFRVIAPFI